MAGRLPCQVLLVLLSAAFLGLTAAAATDYEVPWRVTIKGRLWVMQTQPLSRRPTAPPAYRDYPAPWPFAKGPGILMIGEYEDTPLPGGKAYSEMVFIPGSYKPCAKGSSSASKAFLSVQRIWVDDKYAKAAGREVFGYPKEMAKFTWKQSGPATHVRVEYRKRVIFNATFVDNTAKPSIPPWALSLLTGNQETVQLPILDGTINSSGSSTPQALWSKLTYKFDMTANKLPVRANATRMYIDPLSFTGRQSQAVSVLQAEVLHVLNGTDAALDAVNSACT